jgi:hypothetical protein
MLSSELEINYISLQGFFQCVLPSLYTNKLGYVDSLSKRLSIKEIPFSFNKGGII